MKAEIDTYNGLLRCIVSFTDKERALKERVSMFDKAFKFAKANLNCDRCWGRTASSNDGLIFWFKAASPDDRHVLSQEADGMWVLADVSGVDA